MEKILNFFGTDKVLHFLAGAVIAFIITNVCMIQDGITGATCIAFAAIGLAAAAVIGLIKELIDSEFNWKDLFATILGGLLPAAANAIGALFHLLSMAE